MRNAGLPDIPYLQFDEAVTLTNCDREPIHLPGHIQAHGALVVLNPADLVILQASENLADYCGVSPEALTGKPAGTVFNAREIAALQSALESEKLESNPLYLLTGPLCGKGAFHLTAHVFQGLLTVEMEPTIGEETTVSDYYPLIKQALVRFRAAASLREYCQTVCEEVQKINGFDRVMLYKFHPDGHGEVVGEVVGEADTRERWLGLHYPEGDIPKQARALFVLNTLRLTPDMRYTPCPVYPALNPLTGQPLDMRYCVLRGVSRMCTEQLINLGALATMSLAIVRDGHLWGLITCHHQTPRRVSYDVRSACEFLADVISLQTAEKEAQEFAEYRARMQTVAQTLVASVVRQGKIVSGLTACDPDVGALVESAGCAILAEGQCLRLGQTPEEADVRALAQWVSETRAERVWATDALPDVYAPAMRFKAAASGLLAIKVGLEPGEWVLWFRPETLYTVKWGVEPNKPVESGPLGDRFTPRKAFVRWQETVQNRSLAWNTSEIEIARSLCASLQDVLSRRADRLVQLNAELAKSNAELDAFAYIASHDLKEPLRGITNYARFLQEDYGDMLDAEGREQIATVSRLARRMDSLLDSLLQYSRLGRQELALQDGDMEKIVQETLQILRAGRLAEAGVEVRVTGGFPHVLCDRVQIGEVLTNLITNAIKYNDKPEKWIEIGWLADQTTPGREERQQTPQSAVQAANVRATSEQATFYVRDNGIGIQPQYLETIFNIFKRLHSQDAFGGGAGAGLSIARQIVERHGGNLWVESTPGEGSTFYFTLRRSQT